MAETEATYFHGVTITEEQEGKFSMGDAETAVIAVIGTAKAGTDNEPTIIERPSDLAKFGDPEPGYSLVRAIRAIYENYKPKIVAIKIPGGTPAASENQPGAGEASNNGGGNGPNVITESAVAPPPPEAGSEEPRSRRRIRDRSDGRTDEPEEKANDRILENAVIESATASALYSPTAAEVAAVIGAEANKTGLYAIYKSKVLPNFIIAPYYSHDANVINAMKKVADAVRATCIIDNSKSEEVEAYKTRVQSLTSSRLFAVMPYVTATDSTIGNVPASTFIAGHIARIHAELGFWYSPSNKVMNGISAIDKEISYTVGFGNEVNGEANKLNYCGVNFILAMNGQFRLWGSRNCGTNAQDTADERKHKFNRFLSLRCTTDAINSSVLIASFPGIDENITKPMVQNTLEKINDYLRTLKARGAIVDGSCWIDKDDNPPEQIASGSITYTFDYSGTYPAENVKFKSRITNRYLTEVI